MLMLLATIVPAARAFAYCLIVLAANLAAHIASGSIHEITTVTILGLWIGLPFWTALAAVIPERLASFVMRLNTARPAAPVVPRRVRAWTDDEAPAGPVGDSTYAPPPAAEDQGHEPPASGTASEDEGKPDVVAARLTSRQLQIAALVADGLRYREIAEALAISTGQVHRHLHNAVARMGVANVNELVAVLVTHDVLPDASEPAASRSR